MEPTALAGRYVIERELGRGWMGIVHLAHEPALGRHVALKLLPPDLAKSVRTRALFLREARIAARLPHPNIVPVRERPRSSSTTSTSGMRRRRLCPFGAAS